ncbi:SDR family oxidoreductase, partial [Rhodococcus sp. NPDC059234]|uniref:SDR family oxidoreductase n=1 Tax=Rhodococcus sp. NPDC059234 TaxID=3346781 RepID=UPI00366B5E1A
MSAALAGCGGGLPCQCHAVECCGCSGRALERTWAGLWSPQAAPSSRPPDPAVIDFCAAKAALINFCTSLSKEIASQWIRVNTVSPGPVTTALWTGAEGVAATVSRASGIAAQDVIDHTVASTETGRLPARRRSPISSCSWPRPG